jgi:hypothetical protein
VQAKGSHAQSLQRPRLEVQDAPILIPSVRKPAQPHLQLGCWSDLILSFAVSRIVRSLHLRSARLHAAPPP